MNITVTETIFSDEPDIEIGPSKSEAFLEKAKVVSEFIDNLNLPIELNNQLIDLLIDHLDQAMRDSFNDGFFTGFEFGRYAATHPDDDMIFPV